jgi:tetratricopeptide (TPR) repeat protein
VIRHWLVLNEYEDTTLDLTTERLTYNYNFIQLCIRKQKELEQALAIAHESLIKAQAINDYQLHCLFLQSIAMLNSVLGNQEQSVAYMEELILLAIKQNDFGNIAGASGYVAYVYYTLKNFEKAEEKFNQSEHYARLMHNIHAVINVVLRKIRMYLELGETGKAAQSIADIEPSIVEANATRSNNVFAFLKADYCAQTKDHQGALALLESLAADELYIADRNERMHVYQKLHEQYKCIGDFEKAYTYFEKFYNIRLEITGDERTKTMSELQTKYDSERKEAQVKQLQIDNLNSELRLLKSQMNPHFMFNAIGSVSNLMQSGRVDEAQDSLRKFSRLMRSTLEQSQGDDILLEDEIDFLSNYLHLEKLILGDNFSFTITVDDSIDVTYERIPSLILQPIVENALKHGLRTKQGERKLNISFTLEEDSEQTTMQILIDDNGIGRKASAELNKDRKQHQSFATKSIDERIKIINTTAEFEKITLSFIDKMDAEGGATGTSVLINILS